MLRGHVGEALDMFYYIKGKDPFFPSINRRIRAAERELDSGYTNQDGHIEWKKLVTTARMSSKEVLRQRPSHAWLAVIMAVCAIGIFVRCLGPSITTTTATVTPTPSSTLTPTPSSTLTPTPSFTLTPDPAEIIQAFGFEPSPGDCNNTCESYELRDDSEGTWIDFNIYDNGDVEIVFIMTDSWTNFEPARKVLTTLYPSDVVDNAMSAAGLLSGNQSGELDPINTNGYTIIAEAWDLSVTIKIMSQDEN